jgi:transcriptional regulator with XRE-family HTH domain
MDKTIHTDAYSEFLNQLRATRMAQGVTQAELAARLGTTQSFISKCERGERRLDLVEARLFCMALEVDFIGFVATLHRRLCDPALNKNPS